MNDLEVIRVLLVDDDEDDYILTRGLFTQMKGRRLHVDWFNSYQAGLEAMLRNQHDICLVDYRLGAKNGVELLREAIERGCVAPIILLTGSSQHVIDLEAMMAGAADYLVKAGLRADSLERSIRYALERKRAAAVAAFEQANLAAFGADVGLALTQRDSLDGLLNRCADAMARYLNVHLAQIWILSPSDNKLHLRASTGETNGVNPRAILEPTPEIIGKGKPVLVNKISGAACVPCPEWAAKHGIAAYAAYPMVLEDRLIGLLSLYSQTPLSQSTIQSMSSVAYGIALTVENKRSEEALDASEVKYRSVLETIREVVFQVNVFGHWTSLNPAWEEITGFEVKETLGNLFLEFIHHDDRQRNSHIFLQLMDRKLDYCRYETRLLTKDGKTRWVDFYAQLTLNADGSVLGASGSITDITERKHAEKQIQKLAAFPQVNPNPIMEFDAHGALTYMNEAAREMAKSLGFSQPEAILPENASMLARQALGSSEKKLSEEVSRNGHTISWSFFPIPASQVVHCYGVDTTDMQKLEAQFRQAQKMESVGQLAAGVAHDFNNILTVIQGYSEYLQSRCDGDASITKPLKQISDASRRAAALTRQLLMFSRKQVLQAKTVDLNSVLRNLSNMLGRLLGEDVAVRNEYAPELPAVEADAGMLEQAVMNLAVNARDAMPKGGQLIIRTSSQQFDAAYVRHNANARIGTFLCLEVSDTGCGMDSKTLERIFEPFFSTKEVGKGTGLGLATVYGIVKQHQGWIEVTSQVGVGTAFKLYLPASEQKVVANPEPVAQPAPVAKGRNETILLVEDEAILRMWVKEILESFDYKIVEAANGVEALKVYDSQGSQIDLLLTDMVMPEGISGTDLARQLRNRQPSLKVIYTSGYSAEVMGNEKGLADGPFLSKPYGAPQLAKLVRECLDTR